MSIEPSKSEIVIVKAKPERKVFRPNIKTLNRIPDDVRNDARLQDRIKLLPSNYDFEIPKCIWRIRQMNASRVALQMPEGLLMFAITLCDIIEEFTSARAVIMGDVTYGACCVDDLTARSLRVDLLIHYGHSCLVPVQRDADVKMLYVFVDVKADVTHFVDTVKFNLERGTVALVSTVQFLTTLHEAATKLRESGYDVRLPQSRPLTPGEILGCTAPSVSDADALVYLGDGRFHLESAMIANPKLRAFRYDPYENKMTEEFYDHEIMRATRKQAIDVAVNSGRFGLILGTLGRQGSVKVLNHLMERLESCSKTYAIILLSEIHPHKLRMFTNIEAWIQTSCPRLSIDWGTAFDRPLLTPYEAAVALGAEKWRAGDGCDSRYPMDYYADSSLGQWTPNHKAVVGCCGKGCKDKSL